MNSLTLLVGAACCFALGYRFYSAFLAAKVVMVNAERRTPAHELHDGKDYVPTNRYVLFGHHFAAISGAGPLIGPVLAAQWGVLPGALWIVIGAVLAGAVHDFIILVASVRCRGLSLSEIAGTHIGRLARIVTSIAILFIIMCSLAGLAISVVKALSDSIWGTFSIAATIPIALFVGFYLHVLRPGKVAEASVIGVSLVFAAVIFGAAVPQTPWGHYFLLTETQLKLLLPAYGFVASVLPVWMLLCPRDYLSSYMKIGTICLLVYRHSGGASTPAHAADDGVHRGRGRGGSRNGVAVRVHHHHVRGDLGVPRADQLRHDAEDDRLRGRSALYRLWGDADGGVRCHHGADRGDVATPV